ncbi:MAG TPA: class II aldolase/adducin family protein [Usitatibacter sp.]|nr:class II aldolase/adducin family protein [Usitatibacter sp.]
MTPIERGLRVRLISAARRLNTLGINQGKSGNLSARVDGGFVVTPSGVAYDRLAADDIVFVGHDGAHRGEHAPSSEWRFHHDIYAHRAEAGAVVHTHSPYATTLACLRRPIPPFHYEVAFAGGRDIRCGGYATFGSQELSNIALAALEGRRACLLANHGAVALGPDLDAALALAEKVETLARLYWQTLQLGEPVLLDDEEMERVVEKFKNYGR